MPFRYYDRLSPARQRIYRRSDEIVTLALPAGAAVGAAPRRGRRRAARPLEMYMLEETFHTEGFYKRESSLANALFAQEAATSGSDP
jgi:hypothetical protein